MLSSKKGFTLIELLIVIVILGILASIVVPRFINITSEARRSTVIAMANGLRGAVSLARAQYIVTGNMAAVTVTMDGTVVACNAGTGVPTGTAAGIGTAVQDLSGVTADYTVATAVTFQPTSGGNATCQASYNGTTGLVTPTTTGC